jgi:D-xylose transport system substrate-binding protein
LQPAIDRKDIIVKADQFITDWKPDEALNFVENALTQHERRLQAVVVSNDGMASGVISALQKRGLTAKFWLPDKTPKRCAAKHRRSSKR